jgi:hypothetical protein
MLIPSGFLEVVLRFEGPFAETNKKKSQQKIELTGNLLN